MPASRAANFMQQTGRWQRAIMLKALAGGGGRGNDAGAG